MTVMMRSQDHERAPTHVAWVNVSDVVSAIVHACAALARQIPLFVIFRDPNEITVVIQS